MTQQLRGPSHLRGELVRLRAASASDASFLAALEDEDGYAAKAGYRTVPWTPDQVRRQTEDRKPPSDEGMGLIIETLDGTPAGLVFTHHVDRRAGAFSYGVQVLESHRRRGYASEAIRLLLALYFDELRYQKADVTVYAGNEASLALHDGLGFVREGRRRRATFTGGRHVDQILLGLTAEEFRREPIVEAPDVLYRRRPDLDMRELQDLFAAAWGGGPKAQYADVLSRSLTWIAAWLDDALIGFVNVAWDGGVHAFLLDTTVHPEAQRRGIGTGLVRHALHACAETRGLEWVHVDYEPELARFYARAGFRPIENAALVRVPDLRRGAG